MNRLITTSIDKTLQKENLIFLGEWCKQTSLEKKIDNQNNNFLPHHWSDKEKLKRDYRYLTNLNNNLIKLFTQKLNKIHKSNYSEKSWRIILGSWLPLYLSTMYDRWESLRIFFDKYEKDIETHSYIIDENIFYNYGVLDFVEKVVQNDFWNHKNFIRIIDFQYKSKVNVHEDKINIISDLSKKEDFISQRSFLKSILRKIFVLTDNIFSFVGIRINKIVIENFYHRKTELIKILIGSKIFPAFYLNTFNENKYKKNLKIEEEERKKFFNSESYSNDFEKYLFYAFVTDFPVAYLERFELLKKSNRKLNKLKKDKIFTKVSYIMNERFKLWLAEMVSNKTKLYVGQHGGCLNTKLNGFLGLDKKIADKVLTWNKTSKTNEIQISPIELFRFKKIKNKNQKNLLIVNGETARYPCKIQSHPYAEEYKKSLAGTCKLIKKLKANIKDKIVYRSNDLGYKTADQIKEKFNEVNTDVFQKTSMKDNLQYSRLAICTYPETAVSEIIFAGIPLIIFIPDNLYEFDDDSNEIVEMLKKSKIYFQDPIEAAKHINLIWEDPLKWWNEKNTVDSIKKLEKFAFSTREDWLSEWTNFITSKND